MDKIAKGTYLSLEDVEQLCHLYMDCKLSLLEETELHYVLGKVPYSSLIIDEARTLMDLSLSCAMEIEHQKRSTINKTKKTFNRKWWMVAASIAVLAVVGIYTVRYIHQQQDFYCQVFTNGKKVSKDKAIIIAESELERIDNFFENMDNVGFEQQQMIESL